MKRYCRWHDKGYLSSTGVCFDIGRTTVRALSRFKNTGDPFSGDAETLSTGNGSIMRLAPVPIFYYPDREEIRTCAADSSRTTHGATECLDARRLLGDILYLAFRGMEKSELLFSSDPDQLGSDSIKRIALGGYREKKERDVHGTGQVADCLEAALWSFWTTDSFEEAILQAANLGDDADTTAAVCGQVAGAFYGESGIPARWLDRLAMREEIRQLCDLLRDSNKTQRRIDSAMQN